MKIKTLSNVNNFPGSVSCHPHLSPDKLYFVVGIDTECYRVVNDTFDPVLYPKEMFNIVDSNYPDNWKKTEYTDGEYCIEPPEFSEVGFFEDYFDGVEKVVAEYERYLRVNGVMIKGSE